MAPALAAQSAGARGGSTRLGDLFADEGVDLSLDLGCGYGVGALGVAEMASVAPLNVLGCDINRAGTAFGAGVASRWGVGQRCAFLADDASVLLRRLQRGEYDGRVTRAVVSCPTPFAVSLGGATFPRAAASSLDYFATPPFFDAVADTLGTGSTLHLAANVEDVALAMCDSAMATRRFAPLVLPPSGSPPRYHAPPEAAMGAATPTACARSPRRQQAWRRESGRRASGPAWRVGQLCLPEARSETELAYALEGRQTYRVVLERL